MIITKKNEVPGRKVTELKRIVQGSTVKTKYIGRNIEASFKTSVGGEIRGYSELMRETREEAISRMMEEAEEKGANAIISMRYQTAQVMDSAAEVVAYGTAVVVE